MYKTYFYYFRSEFYQGGSDFCSVSVFAEDFKIIRFFLHLFMHLLYQ